MALSYSSVRLPKIKAPQCIGAARCWLMPCNWSCRVVMTMMQSGLLGASLKAPPQAMSLTSSIVLDMIPLPSYLFSFLFLYRDVANELEACSCDGAIVFSIPFPPILTLFQNFFLLFIRELVSVVVQLELLLSAASQDAIAVKQLFPHTYKIWNTRPRALFH